MTEEKQIYLIQKAKKDLPKSFINDIYERLLRRGISLSISYVSLCLSRKPRAFNKEVFDEFISYCEDIKASKNDSFKRLEELIKN